jgi:hypothetical protein
LLLFAATMGCFALIEVFNLLGGLSVASAALYSGVGSVGTSYGSLTGGLRFVGPDGIDCGSCGSVDSVTLCAATPASITPSMFAASLEAGLLGLPKKRPPMKALRLPRVGEVTSWVRYADGEAGFSRGSMHSLSPSRTTVKFGNFNTVM